jgi:hypothetical protein
MAENKEQNMEQQQKAMQMLRSAMVMIQKETGLITEFKTETLPKVTFREASEEEMTKLEEAMKAAEAKKEDVTEEEKEEETTEE